MTTTIGSITNTPAAGDPIASQWARDITAIGVHVFASKAALDAAWGSAANGSQAWVTDVSRGYVRIAGAWCRCPDYGSTTVTTDSTGFANITHAVGKTPTVVVAVSGLIAGTGAYEVTGTDTYGATTFRVRTSLVSASNSGVRWVAWP